MCGQPHCLPCDILSPVSVTQQPHVIYKSITIKVDHYSGFPHSVDIVLGVISF